MEFPFINRLPTADVISIIINSNTDDWRLASQVEYVAGAVKYLITNNAIIGGTGTVYAMRLNAFTGSVVILTNTGSIIGKSGAGGLRGTNGPGSAGALGGNAIDLLNTDVTINNSSGFILGGGGGGGGGASSSSGGKGSTCADFPGGNGANGAGTNRGGAKLGTTQATNTAGGTAYAFANGGDGGDNGAAGEAGGSNFCGSGGGAGVGGKAIDLNGNTANFNSGGGSPNVKGAVS